MRRLLTLAMTDCIHCGGPIYGDGIVCFWCKGLGPKREIYDGKEYPKDPSSFSDIYLGHVNYKKMRKKNVQGIQNDLT
jgi:hypothetical protein